MKLNLEELQHVMLLLNGVTYCDICCGTRRKVEQEILNLKAIEDAKNE
jgi:hypothetical protein